MPACSRPFSFNATPVAIVVAKARSGAPTFSRATELWRYVSERAIAVVMIKPRDAEVADIDVGATVVIIIADGHSHSPALVRDPRFGGDVFELPFPEIAIKRGARRPLLA